MNVFIQEHGTWSPFLLWEAKYSQILLNTIVSHTERHI